MDNNIEDKLVEVLSTFRIENRCLVSEKFGLTEEKFYVLCPCSIGDTLFVLCMLRSYLKYINNKRQVCIIVKENHKDIPLWFDSDWEVICSSDLTWILNMFSIVFHEWKLDNYLYGHFKKKENYMSKGEDYNWIDPQGTINISTRYSQMLFEMDKCDIDKPNYEFIYAGENKYDVSKKSIILMPYAQTAPAIPIVFWERLANILISKGYDVITNIKDNSEVAISGTRAICVSISEMVKISHEALAVISLRSGMCDVLAFSDVILLVLNTSEELHSEWDVKVVNDREGIMNFMVTNETIGEIFKQILFLFGI